MIQIKIKFYINIYKNAIFTWIISFFYILCRYMNEHVKELFRNKGTIILLDSISILKESLHKLKNHPDGNQDDFNE